MQRTVGRLGSHFQFRPAVSRLACWFLCLANVLTEVRALLGQYFKAKDSLEVGKGDLSVPVRVKPLKQLEHVFIDRNEAPALQNLFEQLEGNLMRTKPVHVIEGLFARLVLELDSFEEAFVQLCEIRSRQCSYLSLTGDDWLDRPLHVFLVGRIFLTVVPEVEVLRRLNLGPQPAAELVVGDRGMVLLEADLDQVLKRREVKLRPILRVAPGRLHGFGQVCRRDRALGPRVEFEERLTNVVEVRAQPFEQLCLTLKHAFLQEAAALAPAGGRAAVRPRPAPGLGEPGLTHRLWKIALALSVAIALFFSVREPVKGLSELVLV